MPITFTVAPHGANQVKNAAGGLSPRQLLAGIGPDSDTGTSFRYDDVGTIRGTSFSRDQDNLSAPQPQTTSKLSRLSKLFERKKSVTASGNKTRKPGHPDRVAVPGTVSNPPFTYIDSIQMSPPWVARPKFKYGDEDTVIIEKVFPRPNGFVHTIIEAYNHHHALILRPDDVWIAILVQFNFYVNARAELLRANFVAHEGKKALVVTTLGFGDFGRLSREMTGLIEKNVVDPSLRAWALPDFSTTTANDITVGSIVLMATLKAYFDYIFCDITCGIPRVTLEGEKADWEKILQRLEKLKEFGLETIAWYHLLVLVISRFVQAFDDPDAWSNISFWQRVAHFEPGGCGPSHYSGWITAFCAFDDDGKWLGPRFDSSIESTVAPESLTAKSFWNTYGAGAYGLQLDDTRFHMIDCANIPPSYTEVDVRLRSVTRDEKECAMTAGAVGMRVCSSNDSTLSPSGEDDTVRPVMGWWLLEKTSTEE